MSRWSSRWCVNSHAILASIVASFVACLIALALGVFYFWPLPIKASRSSWFAAATQRNDMRLPKRRPALRRVGFSNTLFDTTKTYQRDDVHERDRQRDHFQNCYIFVARSAGRRASHVALVVALVCGHSRDFGVYRRVPRRVPNRARVGCVLNFCHYPLKQVGRHDSLRPHNAMTCGIVNVHGSRPLKCK